MLAGGYQLLCPAKACLSRIPAREVIPEAKNLTLSRTVCTTTSLLFLVSIFWGRETHVQLQWCLFLFFSGYCSEKEGLGITLMMFLAP